MKNLEIAAILNNIADILELQGVQFKPAAYRRAARGVESLTEDIAEVAKRGELDSVPGVGESIAEKITEFLERGKLKYYEKLKRQVKVDVEGLKAIPGLGPKRIKILYEKLGVKDTRDLEKALSAGRVAALEGFGEETVKNLREGIVLVKTRPRRFLYAQAAPIVEDILKRLRAHPEVARAEVAGSFRRGKETVGDLDFLVISQKPEKVSAAVLKLPDVGKVLAKGITKTSLRLRNGLQLDFRVLKPKEWGSALMYFIGNKQHNVELRKLALKKGYTLSEYGLFTVKGKKWVAGRTEEEIYRKLDMSPLPPELRENLGEIDAALQGKVPELLEEKDLRGVFHNHSGWSDGKDTLLAMAQRAEQMGMEFISFNDHYGHVGITNPLNEKRLGKYLQEIEKVRRKVSLRVFSGVEIDILKDGTLPLAAKKLRELDVVVASVHVALKMSEKEMTARVCRALEDYPVNILGHPTDRLLNVREPLPLNLDRVFETAQRRKVFLEINSQPARMDLPGELVKAARERGCKFALGTDAHTVDSLPFRYFGVLMARRGWLQKKELLNCWNLPQIERALRK